MVESVCPSSQFEGKIVHCTRSGESYLIANSQKRLFQEASWEAWKATHGQNFYWVEGGDCPKIKECPDGPPV